MGESLRELSRGAAGGLDGRSALACTEWLPPARGQLWPWPPAVKGIKRMMHATSIHQASIWNLLLLLVYVIDVAGALQLLRGCATPESTDSAHSPHCGHRGG